MGRRVRSVKVNLGGIELKSRSIHADELMCQAFSQSKQGLISLSAWSSSRFFKYEVHCLFKQYEVYRTPTTDFQALSLIFFYLFYQLSYFKNALIFYNNKQNLIFFRLRVINLFGSNNVPSNAPVLFYHFPYRKHARSRQLRMLDWIASTQILPNYRSSTALNAIQNECAEAEASVTVHAPIRFGQTIVGGRAPTTRRGPKKLPWSACPIQAPTPPPI